MGKKDVLVSFIYTGKHVRKIAKLFKNTNLRSNFKADDTVHKLLFKEFLNKEVQACMNMHVHVKTQHV
jgi:hypothetical protein